MRLSALIVENHAKLSELECLDTGKPIQQARADIAACARYFEYYGGAADKLHGETIPYAQGSTVLAMRVPHGVTGHIMELPGADLWSLGRGAGSRHKPRAGAA